MKKSDREKKASRKKEYTKKRSRKRKEENKLKNFLNKFWFMRNPYSKGESHSECNENCSRIHGGTYGRK